MLKVKSQKLNAFVIRHPSFGSGPAPRRQVQPFFVWPWMNWREMHLFQKKYSPSLLEKQQPQSKFGAGFTLLEITIVVAVIAVLAATGSTSFLRSRNAHNLTAGGQDVLSTLRTAQARALAGQDNSVWGVHLTQTNITLFRGSNFGASTSTEVHRLPPGIELVSIALSGGGSDILFNRLTGTTDQFGTFTIRISNSPAVTFPITIDASGKVYQTVSEPALSGSRIVDVRHRSFTLGWSIQNAATLTRTFSDPPNPDTATSTAMAPFFDGPKSVFDWSGTIAIAGQNQTMRIHTTSLTSFDTVLSIDYDCRRNTKKVNVKIDGKDIVTYEANCTTVTVGAFGGTMIEP